METRAVTRFEFERLVRRVTMPWPLKSFALLLATYADNDGTRVRPGVDLLRAVTGISDSTVRRRVTTLHREWGLLTVVTRGGGRGGYGRTTEYRLSIPEDLLDRHVLLTPDGWPVDDSIDDSPVTQVNAQSPDSSVTQMTDDCGQLVSTVGDNSETPVTQMTGQSDVDNSNDRSLGTPSDRLTGHWEPIDRSPGWPTTAFDQPPKETANYSPPSPTPDRTSEPVDNPIPSLGRSLDDFLPPSKPPKPPPGPKCPHGLAADRHPDGRPRCPLCRRDAVLDAQPIPVPALAPPEPT